MNLKIIKEKSVGFFNQCVRVWKVLRKPTREEFVSVVKISAIGIAAVG
ncbi:MAG: protein translocase SEC61 complex subunit gamma, partial [Candidatus Pacearchaeota archaeon]